jgi:lysophospholipase L1-like esterase
MIVPPHVAGNQVRLRFSNHFGMTPMTISDVRVGLRGPGASVEGPNIRVRFNGSASMAIPAGAEATTDPVPLEVTPFRELAVSFYLPGLSGPVTMHNLGRQTSFLTSPGTGDHAAETGGQAFTTTTVERLLLDAVDVHSPAAQGVVVAAGDSLTDGDGSTFDVNARWPDDLSRRLIAAGSRLSVVNAGIAANEVTEDAKSPGGGPSLEERFGRDVLEQSGVTDVVVLEGTNDIGFRPEASAADIIAGLANVAARAHAAGLNVIGGTLIPFGGSFYYTDAGEAKRQAINHWVRTTKAFDAVIDADAAVRDPANPGAIRAAYDSGDHLHPNDAGYQAIAQAVDLTIFRGRR